MNLLHLLACVAGALIVYSPHLPARFIWDDDAWIVNNVNLRSAEGLVHTWTRPRTNQEYYPLTISTFWLEYQLWGDHPTGYHINNVLLHAIDAWLIWLLLKRLGVPGPRIAAALFLVHPVNVETVAWATERKNLLAGLCLLTSTLAFVRAFGLGRVSPAACGRGDAVEACATGNAPAASGRANWVLLLLLSVVLYALAVLAKTVAVTLPGALLVLLWWKRGRVGFWDLASIVPHVVVGLPLAVFAVWMQTHHTGATGPEFDLAWAQRLLIAGRAPWFYLGKLLWPWPLMFIYPKWTLDPSQWWQFGWVLLTLVLIAGLWLARWRIGRGPLAAVLIFGGMLLPALGFFNVYWHRYTYVADHVQYHASIALFALAGAGLARLPPRRALVATGALVLILGGLTMRQSWYYYDNERLMRRTAELNPGNAMPHDNLAHCLQEKGKLPEAIEEFRVALKLAPSFPWRLSKAQYNLAYALEQAGQLEEAATYYQLATQTDPAYASAYYNLANCLRELKRYDQAIAHYQRVIELEPGHVFAHNNLAFSLLSAGRYDEAIAAYRKTLELNPDLISAQAGLRRALALRQQQPSR